MSTVNYGVFRGEIGCGGKAVAHFDANGRETGRKEGRLLEAARWDNFKCGEIGACGLYLCQRCVQDVIW